MNQTYCPMCGSEECVYLGTLGNLAWARCRHCGTDYAVAVAEESEDEEANE